MAAIPVKLKHVRRQSKKLQKTDFVATLANGLGVSAASCRRQQSRSCMLSVPKFSMGKLALGLGVPKQGVLRASVHKSMHEHLQRSPPFEVSPPLARRQQLQPQAPAQALGRQPLGGQALGQQADVDTFLRERVPSSSFQMRAMEGIFLGKRFPVWRMLSSKCRISFSITPKGCKCFMCCSCFLQDLDFGDRRACREGHGMCLSCLLFLFVPGASSSSSCMLFRGSIYVCNII